MAYLLLYEALEAGSKESRLTISAFRDRFLLEMPTNCIQKEAWKHLDIFESYLLMGPMRTLKELSQITGVSHGTLLVWSRTFGWSARLAKRDAKAIMALEVENDKLYKDSIKKRHQTAYKSLAEKSLKFIESKAANFSSSKTAVRDAAISLDIAVKGERDVLGMRNTKVRGAVMKDGFAALMEIVMPT